MGVEGLALEPSRENALANWMQSPLRAPARLFLPGLQTNATKVEMKGGQEIFIPACTFMGSRHQVGMDVALESGWSQRSNGAGPRVRGDSI